MYTPSVSTGILPGVIRAEVLKAANARSIAVEEGTWPADWLSMADALFLTNSSVGILPVSTVDVTSRTLTLNAAHPLLDELKIALAVANNQQSVALIDE